MLSQRDIHRMDESTLSSDWIEFTSSSGEVIFYYNRVTKEKKWAQTLRARPVEVNTDQVLQNVITLLMSKVTPGMTSEQMSSLIDSGVLVLLNRLQSKSKTERQVAASKLKTMAHQILSSERVSTGQSSSSSMPQNVLNAQNYQNVSTNRITPAIQGVELSFPLQMTQDNSLTNTISQGYQGVPQTSLVQGYQNATCYSIENDLSHRGPTVVSNSMGYTSAVIQAPREIQLQQSSYNIQIPTNHGSTALQISQSLPTMINNQVSQTNTSRITLRGLLTRPQYSSVASTTNVVHSQETNSVLSNFYRSNQFQNSSGTGNPTTDTRTFVPVLHHPDTNTTVGHRQVSGNQVHRLPSNQQNQVFPQQQVSRASFRASNVVPTNALVGQGHGIVTRQSNHNFQNALGVNIGGKKGTFQNNIPSNTINNITCISAESQPNISVVQNSHGSTFISTQPLAHPPVPQTFNPTLTVHQSKQPVPNSTVVDCAIDRNISKQPKHQSVVCMDSKILNPGVFVNSASQSKEIDLLPRVASVISLAPVTQKAAVFGREKPDERPSSVKDTTANMAKTPDNAISLPQQNKPSTVIINLSEDPTKTGFEAQSHSLNSSGEQIPITDCIKTRNEDEREKDGLTSHKSQSENSMYSDRISVVAQSTNPKVNTEPASRILTEEIEALGPMSIKIESNQEPSICDLNSQNIVDFDNVKESVRTLAIGEATNDLEEEEHRSTSAKTQSKNIVPLDKNVENSVSHSATYPEVIKESAVRSVRIKIEPNQDQEPSSCNLNSQTIVDCDNIKESAQTFAIGEATSDPEEEEHGSTSAKTQSQNVVSRDKNVENVSHSTTCPAQSNFLRVKKEACLSCSVRTPDDDDKPQLKLVRNSDAISNSQTSLHNQVESSPVTVKTESVLEPSSKLQQECEGKDNANVQDSFETSALIVPDLVKIKTEPFLEEAAISSIESEDDSPLQHHLSSDKVESDTRTLPEAKVSEANTAAVLPSLEVRSEISEQEQQPLPTLSLTTHSSDHYASTNIQEVADRDGKLQSIKLENKDGLEFNTETATVVKLECLGNDQKHLEPAVVCIHDSEEEDLDKSNESAFLEMYNLLDYLPAKKLRAIEDEREIAMDFSSNEDDHASILDGRDAVDSIEKETISSASKIVKRKIEVSTADSPSKKKKIEGQVSGETGVKEFYGLISDALESCHRSRSSSSEAVYLSQSSTALDRSLLSCRGCGMTFTEPIALQGHDCRVVNESSYHCRSCSKDFTSTTDLESHTIKPRKKSLHCVYSKSKGLHLPSSKQGTKNSLLQKSRLEAGELTHNMRSRGNVKKTRIADHSDISNNKSNSQAKENVEEDIEPNETGHNQSSIESQVIEDHVTCKDIDNSKTCPSKFKCQKCCKRFKDETAFKKHKRFHIKQKTSRTANDSRSNSQKQLSEKPFKCKQCTKAFKCASNLSRHLSRHSKSQLQCEHCGEKTTNPRKHKQRCSMREKHYNCTLCQKSFATARKLERHKKTHDRPYQCEECCKRFSEITLLTAHQRRHSNERPFPCDLCNKSFKHKHSLKIHYEKHRDGLFTCKICNKTFDSDDALKSHLSTHSVKTFKCKDCDEEFNLSALYERHREKHHKKSLVEGSDFKCSHCQKSYANSYRLKRHLATHTGKKVKCNECDKLFLDNHDMKKHLRTHTGERPYKCTECDWAFFQSSQLYKHLRNVHDKGKETADLHKSKSSFVCDNCSREFTDIAHLKRHFLTHTGEKPFECQFCNFAFREKHHLTRHLISHHSGRKSRASTALRKEAQEQETASADLGKVTATALSEKGMPITATGELSSVRGSDNQEQQKISSPTNERKRNSRSSSVHLSQESENPFFPSQVNSQLSKPVVLKRRRTSSDHIASTPEPCETSKEALKLDSQVTKYSIISAADEPTDGTEMKTIKHRSFQSLPPATVQKAKQTTSSKESPSSMTDDSVKQKEEVNSIIDRILQQKSAHPNSSQHRNEKRNQQSKLNLRLIDPLPLPQSLGRKHQTPPASPRKLVKDKNAISNDKMNELKRTMELRRQLSLGTICRSDEEKPQASTSILEGQGEKSSAKLKVTRSSSCLPKISSSRESAKQNTTPIKKSLLQDSQTTPRKQFLKKDPNEQMHRLSNENNAFKEKTAEQNINTSVSEETKQISRDGISLLEKLGNETISDSNKSSSFDAENLQKQHKEMINQSLQNSVPRLHLMSSHTDEKNSLDDHKKGEKTSQDSEVTSSTEFSKRLHGEENNNGTFEDKEQRRKSSQEELLEEGELEEGQEGEIVNETNKCETSRGIENQEKEIQQSECVNLKHQHVCERRDVAEHLEENKLHEAGADNAEGKPVENNKSKGDEKKEKEVKFQKAIVQQESAEVGIKTTESKATEAKQDIQEEEEIAKKMQKVLEQEDKRETKEMVLDNVKVEKQLDKEDDSEKRGKGEEKEDEVRSSAKETKEAKEVERREKDSNQSFHEEQKETEEYEQDGKMQVEAKENKEKEVEEKFRDKVPFEQKEDKVGQSDKITEDPKSGKESLHQEVEESEMQYKKREKDSEAKGAKGTLSRVKNESKPVKKCRNISADQSQQCNEVSSSIENSPKKVQSGNHVPDKGKEKCSQRKEGIIKTKQCAKIRSRHCKEKSNPSCPQTAAQQRTPSERRDTKRNNTRGNPAESRSTVECRSGRTTSRSSRTHSYKRSVYLEHPRRTSTVYERKRHLPDENISAHSGRESRRYRSPSAERGHKRHFYHSERYHIDFRDGREPIRNDDHRNESSSRFKRVPTPDPRDSYPFHRRRDERRLRSPQRKRATSRYKSREGVHHYRKRETHERFAGDIQNHPRDIPPLLPKQELQDILSRPASFSIENSWTRSGQGPERDEKSGSSNCYRQQKQPSEGTYREEMSSNRQELVPQQREWRPETADQRCDRVPPHRRPSQGRRSPLLPDPVPRSSPGNPYFGPVFNGPPMPQMSFRGYPVLVNDNLPGIVPLNVPFNPWNV